MSEERVGAGRPLGAKPVTEGRGMLNGAGRRATTFVMSAVLTIIMSCAAEKTHAQSGGLVAAYGFDEGLGFITADESGQGNAGAINGATWVSGRFGMGLEFDGTGDLVTVSHSTLLDLTTGMTLEAWVFPTATGNVWRDVVYKGFDDIYYLGGSSPQGGAPAMGGTFTPSPVYGTSALPADTWTYLAATYDGAMMRLYANGVQVASRTQSDPINTSTGELTIGGDLLYGQYWQGRIDEVRVYDRALSATEIQSDMLTPVGSGPGSDQTPPSVSIISPIQGATTSHVIAISADATDNEGVFSVQLFVDGNSLGVDSTAPFVVSWNTTTLANGSHTLTAAARDGAGNSATSAPLSVTTSNPGFVNEVVVPDMPFATTIAFLPDGRMLVGELTESIWVVQPGANQVDPTPFLQLDSSQLVGEQGLMDVLPDRDFAQNGYYYVFYTRASPGSNSRNRVSRFTATGATTVEGSEVVLWEDDLVAELEHHGGGLAFGTDGKLYITYGDQFIAENSQRLDTYRGKILRINSDGSIPLDNPFHDGSGPNRDEIWALGLRNPFRMSIDPVTDRMFIGDVGGNDASTAVEEVNIGLRGANYGWPLCEGNCGVAGVTSPVFSYPHLGRDASITGGFVYRGSRFPSEYDGSYFFGDYVQNTIKRLTFDANGGVAAVLDFWPPDGTPDGPLVGDPVKLIEAPDGSLYYIDLGFNDQHVPNPSAIRRIRPVSNDQPPAAVATGTPISGLPPLTVSFSSAGSFDPEGATLTFSWTFGDGASSEEPDPTHTYLIAGMYVVRLTVSDGVNSSLAGAVIIRVGSVPTATILAPADGSTFRAGEVISFSGSASDPEDGPQLPLTAFSWTVVFHHEGHVHPGLGPLTNVTAGSFAIPTSGHDFQGATSYEIILTVTDSTGLSSSTSVTVLPQKVNLTFNTAPSGLILEINGISKQTPFVLDELVGFQDTISAPNQSNGGTSYSFVAWSDGGSQSHGIVVPELNSGFLATFQASAPTGLIGAYAFDEGFGTTTADASGNNNPGALTNGPTWTTGRYGQGLSLDGADDFVNLNSPAALDNQHIFSYCAWVHPRSMGGQSDGRIIHKGSNGARKQLQIESSTANGLGLYVDRSASAAQAISVDSVITLNQWQYVCGTYSEVDGPRLFVNGREVAYRSRAVGAGATVDESSGNLHIGNRSTADKGWDGLIDDVRIYSAVITGDQMQADMAGGVGTPVDTVAPSAPSGLSVTPLSTSEIALSWTASTDNVAVTGYEVERCSGTGCSNFTQVVTWPETAFNDAGLFAGTEYTYRVRARDGASNLSGYSPIATAATAVANSGFVNESVVTNLNVPTSIEFLPDGRMLIGTFNEAILVVPPGASQPSPSPVLQMSTVGVTGEQGLFDLAVDNSFDTNGHIYAFYTNGSVNRDRLSRFTMTGNIADPASEVVIWQDDLPSRSQHHGGSIAFGNDGKIYLSTGEHDIPTDAQLLTNYHGKILRFNLDGTIPTDNPFYDGGGGNYDAIWARGLRNPFRMSIDTITGNMYIGDVGGDAATSHEEVNLGIAGANYGWPDCDGPCGITGHTNPIYSYVHGSVNRDASITGGIVYRGTQFPPELQGNYFFADYAQNWVRRLTFTDPSGRTVEQMAFVDPPDATLDDPAIGDPVDMKEGPDGSVYYIDFSYTHRPDHGVDPSPTSIRRIRFTGNRPPVVAVSANPTIGLAPLTVSFSSVGTVDPEGDPLSYSWGFGDGTFSTLASPAHIYQDNGPYIALLAVTDGSNVALSDTINIAVGNPPEATIVTPSDGMIFRAGDVISISGLGQDTDGSLAESAFTWTIEFLHESHVHPGGAFSGTRNLEYPIAASSGHDYGGFTRYRITLTVTDSDGLQDSSSVIIYPEKVNLSFDTVPSRLTLKVDGVSYASPFVKDTLVGYSHTIEAPGNVLYAFESWSDGGAQTHVITVPQQDTSYLATFSVSGVISLAAYAFDEGFGSTTADASGSNNPGALTNGPTWTTGRYGQGLSFDGADDFVNLNSPATLDNQHIFSYCAWVHPRSMGGQNDGRIIHKGSNSARKQMHVESSTSNGLSLYVDRSAGAAHAISVDSVITLNQWQYVCGTYSETDGPRLFVNGGEVAYRSRTVGAGATVDESSGNFHIGNRSTADKGWDGLIDDVRIYSAIITAVQMQADMAGGVGTPVDTVAPSAPSALLAAAVSTSEIALSWSASTDNVAVTGYVVERCSGTGCSNFSQIATPSETVLNDPGLSAGTDYTYRVRARDGAGNLSGYSPTASATTAIGVSGLVAAYAFDEGFGSTTADVSGNNNPGTLTNGPTWTTGRYGQGLSFDGADDFVNLNSPAGLDNQHMFSYCAWVYPRSMGGQSDGRIIHKGSNSARKQLHIESSTNSGLGLYVDRSAGAARAISVDSVITLNQWQYVCGTYSETDGPRLFVNGVEVAYRSRTVGAGATVDESFGNFHIGNRSTADKGWDGLIDNVRIHNRVLSASEIQAGMNEPVALTLGPHASPR